MSNGRLNTGRSNYFDRQAGRDYRCQSMTPVTGDRNAPAESIWERIQRERGTTEFYETAADRYKKWLYGK